MRKSKLVSLFLGFCLLCSACFVQASAADNMNGLDIKAFANNRPVFGVGVKLYYIADSAGNWSDMFNAYGLNFNVDDSGAAALASALQALVSRDGIPEDYSGTTDDTGTVRFSYLPAGVWLVVGSDYNSSGTLYKSRPGLVVLDYDMNKTVELKHDVIACPEDIKTAKRVLKSWDDGDYPGRPDYITVQLLRDGAVYDTQVLSDSNNWRYTWSGLSGLYHWDVIEPEVPYGYTASMSSSGITVLITNIRDSENGPVSIPTPEPMPSQEPDWPEESYPVESGWPVESWPVWPTPGPESTPSVGGTTEPAGPVNTSGIMPGPGPTPGPDVQPEIPQTGTTWHHVPVLAGAGVGLIALGLLLKNKDGDGDA